MAKGVGRKSPYDASLHPVVVRELAQQGLTNVEIAARIGVNPDTIYEWQKRHAEFSEAIKEGKSRADDSIEGALYKRAVGYEVTETEGEPDGKGGVKITKVRRVHVPPNVTAQIFWLKNRRGSQWRDVHKLEHVFDRTEALEGVTKEDEAAVEALVEEVLGGDHKGDGRGR